jgi:hypothetical protein
MAVNFIFKPIETDRHIIRKYESKDKEDLFSMMSDIETLAL